MAINKGSYRFSKFVSVLNKNKKNYLFNSLTGGLLQIDSNSASQINADRDLFLIKNKKSEIVEYLANNKYLASEHDDRDALNQLRYIHLRKAFQSQRLSLVIAPTLFCNFKCPYCYEKDLPNIKMTDDIQKQIIEFVRQRQEQHKMLEICWHGGEPTTAMPTIEKLLNLIREKIDLPLKSHTLITNGYFINDNFIRIFRDFPLKYIQITIDGGRSSHNKNRISKTNEETYDRIISNVDRLTTDLPQTNIGIRMNVHKNNSEEFIHLYKELHGRWENKKVQIYPAFVMDNQNCKVPCFNSKEKTFFLYELYKAIGKKYSDADLKIKIKHCTAHYENSFVIDPEGKLYKCWVDVGQQEKSIGNLKDGVTNYTLVSDYQLNKDKFTDNMCLKCRLFPICSGGCSRYRFEDDYKTNDLCPISEKEIINFMI